MKEALGPIEIKGLQVINTESPTERTIIYFHIESENFLDNLLNRCDRPHHEYRKLVPQILAGVGIDPSTKVVWSQKAGCSCGCSPGFILQGLRGKMIFVTI